MIERKDLKVGDTAWYGRLEFGKKFSCIRSLFCQVKIVNINEFYISFEWVDKGRLSRESIPIVSYGDDMSNSLYESEKDLKEDWNSIVLNEIDHITSFYQKHLKLIKKKIKE